MVLVLWLPWATPVPHAEDLKSIWDKYVEEPTETVLAQYCADIIKALPKNRLRNTVRAWVFFVLAICSFVSVALMVLVRL